MPDIFDQIAPEPLQGAKPTPSKGLKFNDSSAAGAPRAPQTEQVSAQTPSTGDIFDKISPNEDIFDQLQPDDFHYRQLYAQQGDQGLSDVAKGAWEGIKALGNTITGSAKELGQTLGSTEADAEQNPLGLFQSEGARKLRATMLEGAAQTGRNYLNMFTKDIPNAEDLASGVAGGLNPSALLSAQVHHEINKPGGMVRNLLKKTGIINPTPEQEEAEYQSWKRTQQDKEELAKTPAAPAALQQLVSGGAEPLPNLTSAVSMVADPANFLSLGASPAAQTLTKIGAAAETASAAEKAARMAGNVMTKGGKVFETVGEIPEIVARKATEAVLGPEAADSISKVTGLSNPIAKLAVAQHVGLGPVAGGLEAAKRLGQGAQLAGEAATALADADRNNPFGRLAAIAKDPDSPEWMRYAASSPLAKLAAPAAQAVGDVAAGTLHGAAIGAALGSANSDTPEELGQSIGQMGAFGGAARALTLPAQNRARVMQKMADAAAELYQQHVSEGVSPETLKKVGDSTMMNAAAAQKMFGDVKVRFLDGESGQFADQAAKSDASPHSAGFWDPTARTIYLNADSGRGADTTLLHELTHPLFDSVVANRPELKAQIDASLSKTGKTLDQAKQDYAQQIVGDKQRFTNPDDYDRAVTQFIDRMDKGSEATHNDQNHWIYSELMAEAGMKAMKGKNLVTDIIDPSLSTRAVQASKSLLEGLGVKFNEGQNGRTILPNFEDAITSPELRKSTYSLLRSMKEHRPGIDEPEPQGVKITPETLGQHPGAPVHVLPNGELGNDFMSQSSSGQVTPRPNKDIRKIVKSRRAEVNAAYPLPQTEAPLTQDPKLQWRKTPSGLSERSGTSLGPDFDKLRSFNDDTKAKAHDLESAIANGEARQGWYQQIGEGPDWRGSVSRDTGNVTAQHKQFLPINFHVDKAGNVLVRNYSLGAFNDKAQMWSGRHGDLSLDLWNGNVGEFKNDVAKYLDNHKQGLSGDTGIGEAKKNAINAFLVGKNATWEKANPLRSTMRGNDSQGVVRSYRLDRLETLAPHETQFTTPDYAKQVKNLSPDLKRPIEVTGPDGKKYKATYDGDQDFSAIGKGMVPQITMLEEAPGFTKHTTTYGPSLESKGYKFELPKAEAPQSPDLPKKSVADVADEYLKGRGIEPRPSSSVPVNERLAKRLASFYQEATHAPEDPKVKASYDALSKEIVDQYHAIKNAGYNLEPFTGEGEPYKSSADMVKDVQENKHLYYLPTSGSFGGPTDNLMLKPSGVGDAPVNDIFRAVHDFFGHAKEGYQFGPKGEYNAWREHSKMFSPEAQGALAAETLAQNSWVNFGKHLQNAEGKIPAKGEPGHVPAPERPFAEQKNIAVPDRFIKEAGAPQLSPDLSHWSNQEGLKTLDPEMHGTGLNGAERARMRDYPELYQKRTYFGLKGYEKEPGLGENKYKAKVAAKDLYDYERDPKDLFPGSDELEKAGYAPMDSRAAVTLYEKKIKDAGYEGYVNKTAKVAAKFTSTDVTPSQSPDLKVKDKPMKDFPDREVEFGAWLDPDGNFYKVPFQGHEEWAQKQKTSGEELFKKGWTRVLGYPGKSNPVEDSYRGIYADTDKPLTKAQKSALEDLGFARKQAIVKGDNSKVLIDSTKDFAPEYYGTPGHLSVMSPDVPREMPDDKELSRYASRIATLTEKKGGASFDVTAGKAPTKGFSVSLYPDRTQLIDKGDKLTPEAIKSFAQKNADLLAQPDHVVGTWNDKESGKTYLDVSYIAPNENIAKHAAEMFNQKAYWDIKGQKEVKTSGNGEPMENTPPALERVPQAKASFAKTQELPQGEIRGPVQVALPEGTDNSKARVRTIQESQNLSLEALKNAPDTEGYRKKVVEQFRTQPGFRDIDPSDTNKAIDEIDNRVQQNLQFLYDRATPEDRALWKQWYDFAHDMSHRWGKEYGVHGDVVSAINARLSPQMEWNNNVTLTRRALDTIKKDPTVTQADLEFLKSKVTKPEDTAENPRTTTSKNLEAKQLEALAGMKVGDKMSELDALQAGMLMRSHNELYAARSPLHDHNLKRIPGDYLKWSKPFQDLADVVDIYRNPSFENVSNLLGVNHKVRSFYNNHVDPKSPLWTTIDTHATAAANLYPYGGSDKAVISNFGNPNHKNSGVNGVYPVYQDAYEKVAQKNGILPRELQSIVWEQMRKELNPAAKRMVQDAQKKAAEKGAVGPFETIWAKAEKGEITREEAQKQLVAEFEKWNAKANHGAAAAKRAGEEATQNGQMEMVTAEEIARMKREFETSKKRGNEPLPRRSPPKVEEPNPTPINYRKQRLPEEPF